MGERVVFQAEIELIQLARGQQKSFSGSRIKLVQNDAFEARFEIVTGNNDKIIANIKDVINLAYHTLTASSAFDVKFNQKLYNFVINFPTATVMDNFVNEYVKCVYEQVAQRKTSSQDKSDLERYKSYYSLDKKDQEYDDDFYFSHTEYESSGNADEGKNVLLRLDPSSENSLVMRRYPNRTDLGVFELDRDCRFKMALPKVICDDNHYLKGTDMLTSNRYKELLMLDQEFTNQIYDLNLDRGVVVKHYNATDSYGVDHTVSKLMPTTYDGTEATFLAFNQKDTMLFDPRTSNGIVNKSDYKKRNLFTCGVTTRNGKLAMGSADGVLRLYSEPCKSRATVNFEVNAGAEEIIGLDVSPDEQWVLITCPYYLSVVNVKAQSTGKLAFNAPMGKDKPPLTRLFIQQEHQQQVAKFFNGMMPPFSPAKFEIKSGKPVAIVAGIGSGLVSWDFRQIENGTLPFYSITLVGEESINDDHPFILTSDVMFISDNQVSVVERQRKKKH